MNLHRKLPVWQDAQRLVLLSYDITDALPDAERFVARDQLRRAAWSVHNNIAEGNARRGGTQFRRFADIALASLAEVDAMVATLDLKYQLPNAFVETAETLRRSINAQLHALCRTRKQ